MMTPSAIPPHSSARAVAASAGEPRFFALVPCAGQGSRAGTTVAKQYEPVCGQPMVWHTLQAFRHLARPLAGLWVAVTPGDELFAALLPGFGRAGERVVATGGPTRAATVLGGLRALLATGGAGLDDWVLVHDAARCLVTPAQIEALIAACEHDEVGGLLAQKLPDTLKRESGGRVAETVDRSDKWLAQTPQMFRIGLLVRALECAGSSVTDEASAIEALGLAPLLVSGSAQNFKVTYPEDFALAAAVLASRMASAAHSSAPEYSCG